MIGAQKEISSMKYAFDNANLIDGTKDMRVQPNLRVLRTLHLLLV